MALERDSPSLSTNPSGWSGALDKRPPESRVAFLLTAGMMWVKSYQDNHCSSGGLHCLELHCLELKSAPWCM
jgi:hypothetical protein